MYKHKMTGSTKKAQSQLRSNARHCQTHPTAAGSWHRHAQHHTVTYITHNHPSTAQTERNCLGRGSPVFIQKKKKNSSQTNRTFSKAWSALCWCRYIHPQQVKVSAESGGCGTMVTLTILLWRQAQEIRCSDPISSLGLQAREVEINSG